MKDIRVLNRNLNKHDSFVKYSFQDFINSKVAVIHAHLYGCDKKC